MNAQEYATDVVKRLVNAGYTAYFAGGWVRDYLMGHPSDDIDIATDAPPDVILDLFPQTILVGLAFGVVVVVVDGHQFEVATFRRDVEYIDGRKPTQIELSTPEEDAARRDFTINGMFYDPLKEVVIDLVHGREDLQHKIIRTIGDPYDRFFEDRLRMIRAVRFSARFGFTIDAETQEAVIANADTLFPAVAMERIWQELVKMSKYSGFDTALVEMHRLGLLPVIFSELNGIHLNEIRSRVAHFEDFPKGSAAILFLMELFPHASYKEAEELCRYLRTSSNEMHLAELVIRSRQLATKEEQELLCDKVEWVHFYSHPQGWRCLQIIAARLPDDLRSSFLEKHRGRGIELEKHVARIIQKKPLVSASLLQSCGIAPGRRMGDLLKKAERIAIMHDLDDAQAVINILKSTKELS